MISIVATLGLIFLLAFLIETLMEFIFGTLTGLVIAIAPSSAAVLEDGRFRLSFVQLCAIATGITGAFIYNFDVLFLMGKFAELNDIASTTYGVIITGIAIGKGSNYIHQLIQKFFPVKEEK